MNEIQNGADFQLSLIIYEKASEIRKQHKAMSLKEIVLAKTREGFLG
jgi:hypothetical protein